jgi:putative MATE family efflux protein
MRDLTKDSITHHILTMAAQIAINVLAQIAYQLLDLYFVTRIGVAATAGVNAAGNVTFVVTALVQVLVAGTLAPIAQAIGRKDHADANLVFNQALALAVVCGITIMILLRAFVRPYLESVAADAPTVEAGVTFIAWVLPGSALSLPLAVFSSALRGTGIMRPAVAAYLLTILTNAVLAPVLIAGWGTGVPLGVQGAGLATSVSVLVGVLYLGGSFHRLQRVLTLNLALALPQLRQWRRILNIGLPAGAEFGLMFLSAAVVYYTIRDLGASAQAGFGIGSRVLQAILLPGMVVATAAAPVAGQNFGARNTARVRETFRKTVLIEAILMLAAMALVQWRPEAFVSMFDADDEAIAVAAVFLQAMSWTFVAQGFVYACSTMFQGLGNTLPSLISSAARFLSFAVPAVWLSMQSHVHIEQVWYLLVASILLQAALSFWLLRAEFRRRLVALIAT